MPKENQQTSEQMQQWILEKLSKDGKRPSVASWPPPPPVQPAEPVQRRERPRPRKNNPRFLSVVNSNPAFWRNAIRTMSLFSDEVPLSFAPEGFTYRSMDPQHIALWDLDLPARNFDKYEVTKGPVNLMFEYQSRTTPPSPDTLKPVLDKIYRLKPTTIAFDLDDSVAESDLTITLGDDRTTLNSLETSSGTAPLPNLALPASFKTTGEVLANAVRSALWQERVYKTQGQGRAKEKVPTDKWKQIRDSNVRFVATKDGVSVQTAHDYIGNAADADEPNPDYKPGESTDLTIEQIIDYSFTGTQKKWVEKEQVDTPITEAASTFSSEWLLDYIETFHPDMVTVQFGDKIPICISENIQQDGLARFWLAPRVSD